MFCSQGSLTANPGEVVVAKEDGTTETISTKNVILATGSEPAALPGVEVDEETIVTSTGALDLKEASSFFLLLLFAYTNFVFFRFPSAWLSSAAASSVSSSAACGADSGPR